MSPIVSLLAVALVLVGATQTEFLRVTGTQLSFKGKPVFLSGANLAWINYGNDFGNNQTHGHQCELQAYVRNVSAAGGNSIRIWLFVEGQSIPQFDSSGLVTATDAAGSLVGELRELIGYAATQNVFVVLTLWNGALMRNDLYKALLLDRTKLNSFISAALIPLVAGLKDLPGLGAYEIMNEPEGSVDPGTVDTSQPCFDTASVLEGSGAGWAGSKIPMKQLQQFANLQAAAIKAADPKALVTVGSWSQYASTDVQTLEPGRKFFNYWKDQCLVAAGGDATGTLDLYQIHTYAAHKPDFAPSSPFGSLVSGAAAYRLDKPVVVGEFSAGSTGGGRKIGELYQQALSRGFSGAWDWSLLGGDGNDDLAVAVNGMNALESNPKVKLDILGADVRPVTDSCACSDTPPPPGQYSCAQQAGFGKCSASWMKGFCCRSCHGCRGCK